MSDPIHRPDSPDSLPLPASEEMGDKAKPCAEDPSRLSAGPDASQPKNRPENRPENSEEKPGRPAPPRFRYAFLFKVGPFFLSALFFLSVFFALIAPLPILLLAFRERLQVGRVWAWAALVTNGALVFLAAGGESVGVYFTFVGAPTIVLYEILQRKRTLEQAAVGAFLAIALLSAAGLGGYAGVKHVNPLREIKHSLSTVMDQLAVTLETKSSGEHENPPDPADIEEWKQEAWHEFPSAVALVSLVLVWANLLLLMRLNPGGLRERLAIPPDYFIKWKAPDWLVWPTILLGATLILDAGFISAIGLSLFKIVMFAYAVQALSVLAYFFQLWKFPRFLKTVGYLVAILAAMPLLLAIGFFDLWFDFRAKFRQV